jgi:hypothetical protein
MKLFKINLGFIGKLNRKHSGLQTTLCLLSHNLSKKKQEKENHLFLYLVT